MPYISDNELAAYRQIVANHQQLLNSYSEQNQQLIELIDKAEQNNREFAAYRQKIESIPGIREYFNSSDLPENFALPECFTLRDWWETHPLTSEFSDSAFHAFNKIVPLFYNWLRGTHPRRVNHLYQYHRRDDALLNFVLQYFDAQLK